MPNNKKSCYVTACEPGKPASDDNVVEIEHGGAFHGHERQADGSCKRVEYKCDDGKLVPKK